jgi:hypothetical protein
VALALADDRRIEREVAAERRYRVYNVSLYLRESDPWRWLVWSHAIDGNDGEDLVVVVQQDLSERLVGRLTGPRFSVHWL